MRENTYESIPKITVGMTVKTPANMYATVIKWEKDSGLWRVRYTSGYEHSYPAEGLTPVMFRPTREVGVEELRDNIAEGLVIAESVLDNEGILVDEWDAALRVAKLLDKALVSVRLAIRNGVK